jgi:hypothetical protein
MDPQTHPFAVLSFIVAPAMLTNASSVLALSTSNRLARAVDRARELAKQLEATTDLASPQSLRRMRELDAAERRSLLLLSALRSFYIALGSFSAAVLVSLLGAILTPVGVAGTVRAMEFIGVLTGAAAIAALIHGSVTLIRETRIAVQIVRDRIADIHTRATESAIPRQE